MSLRRLRFYYEPNKTMSRMFPEKAKSKWTKFKWRLVLGKDADIKKIMSEPNPFLT